MKPVRRGARAPRAQKPSTAIEVVEVDEEAVREAAELPNWLLIAFAERGSYPAQAVLARLRSTMRSRTMRN